MSVSQSDQKVLSLRQIDQLIAAVRGRYTARDRCLILLAFRHGLGVGEVCAIQLRDVDLKYRQLRIRAYTRPRTVDRVHPLRTDEIQAVDKWLSQRAGMKSPSDDLFISATRKRISRKTVWRSLKKYGIRAGLTLSVNPDILRASCRSIMQRQGVPLIEIQAYFGRNNEEETE